MPAIDVFLLNHSMTVLPILDVSKYILSALATPASVSALSESTY